MSLLPQTSFAELQALLAPQGPGPLPPELLRQLCLWAEAQQPGLLAELAPGDEGVAARTLRELLDIFDTATVALLLVDEQRRVRRCNRRMEEMLGYGPGELLGLSTRSYFVSDADWEQFGVEALGALRAGHSYAADVEVLRKDGSRLWCSSHGRAVDPADPRRGSIWVGVDVSERREAERMRRQRLLEYQAILDNASVGITFTRDCRFLHCNERFGEMFGWPAQALVGQPTSALYPDEAAFQALSEQAVAALGAGQRLDVELQMRRRDGSLFWCRMLAKAIDPLDAGKGTIFITEDISARREADGALKQALTELQAIFDNTSVGILLVHERRSLRCNRGLEQMLGYGPGEMTGRSTRRVYATDADYESLGREAYEVLNRGEVWTGETRLQRKDGVQIDVSLHARAMDASDPSKGTLWVSQDITERKRTEAALRAANEKLAHSLEVVEQTYREISLLSELSSFLQSCESAHEAYDCLHRYGPRLFPGSGGALYLQSPGSDLLEEQLSWGELHGGEAGFGNGDCWALRRGRPHLYGETGQPLRCPHLRLAMGESACLPLMAQGDTFGLLLVLYATPLDGTPEARDRRERLAVALAEQAGLALANIRLRETLRLQSIRDPLTGLYNRRFLDEALRRELARAKRQHTGHALAIVDVDHFKQFNDRHGHEAGDLVLQQVARALQTRVRESDVVCRFGGEEFVVLLAELSPEQARLRAEALLEAVRSLQLSHAGQALGRLSASLGLAFFPQHGEHPQALLEAADAALYRAKRGGRDRLEEAGAGLMQPGA